MPALQYLLIPQRPTSRHALGLGAADVANDRGRTERAQNSRRPPFLITSNPRQENGLRASDATRQLATPMEPLGFSPGSTSRCREVVGKSRRVEAELVGSGQVIVTCLAWIGAFDLSWLGLVVIECLGAIGLAGLLASSGELDGADRGDRLLGGADLAGLIDPSSWPPRAFCQVDLVA